jgi:hypothetical protein
MQAEHLIAIIGGTLADDTEATLCAAYDEFLRVEQLPEESADELIHRDTLSDVQRLAVSAFYSRWEAMAARTWDNWPEAHAEHVARFEESAQALRVAVAAA